MGCPSVRVLARRPEAAEGLRELAGALGVAFAVGPWPRAGEHLPGRGDAAIVVCTAPATASAGLVGAVPARPGSLLDVSYHPWPPPLVAAWRAAGGPAVGGDEMLLHQAVAQVELMTGRRPAVAAMRAALRGELDRRAAG
jgi:shikimate dehydrogenase